MLWDKKKVAYYNGEFVPKINVNIGGFIDFISPEIIYDFYEMNKFTN